MLPTLKLNRPFVKDLMAAQPPCFAMGMVEERMSHCAFLALRVPDEIPSAVTTQGFSFGHAVLGTDDFEVLHFAFHFYGFRTYHTLVNPSVPLAKSVLAMMLETGEYLFFALAPPGAVTVFKAEVGESTLQGIRDHLERINASITSDIVNGGEKPTLNGGVVEECGMILVWPGWQTRRSGKEGMGRMRVGGSP